MAAKTAVIDASIAAKWFFEESESKRARALLAKGLELIAPDLIFAEVLNTYWKEIRRDDRPAKSVLEIVDLLSIAFTRLIPIPDLASDAAGIAIELDHPIYDGFYLALAGREQCPLITGDEHLFRKTRKTRFASTVQLLASFA